MFAKGKGKQVELNPSASVSSSTARRLMWRIGMALVVNFVVLVAVSFATGASQCGVSRAPEEPLADLRITAGPYEFGVRWERGLSPKSCEAFEGLLPYRSDHFAPLLTPLGAC